MIIDCKKSAMRGCLSLSSASSYRPTNSAFSRTARQLQALRNDIPAKQGIHSRNVYGSQATQSGLPWRKYQHFPTTTCFSRQTSSPAKSVSEQHELQSTDGHGVVETEYQMPRSGILSRLPRSWIPYAELIRIDKPAGTNYLFLPCAFSTLLAAPLTTPVVEPYTVAGTIGLFYAGAMVMRGAGCTINDLWDRNLDSKVARTRLRPIARGAISVGQALPYLGVQLMAGLAILLQFPQQCFFYATPSLILVTIYPLAKRVTYYPQLVLGLTFSWGAFIGYPALGIDLLHDTSALLSAACLYSSCVVWTLIYDMIYAYQDIRDDAKAGIKSIALAHDGNAKRFLSIAASVQIALLAASGAVIGASPLFYVGVCGGAASTLAYMIRVVDLNNVKDCWAWFRRGAWLTGGAITLGLAAEYAAQYLDLLGVRSKRKPIQAAES